MINHMTFAVRRAGRADVVIFLTVLWAQFPGTAQPRVGSDLGAVELKLQSTVKIEPQNPDFRFTHRVSHINAPNQPITY